MRSDGLRDLGLERAWITLSNINAAPIIQPLKKIVYINRQCCRCTP